MKKQFIKDTVRQKYIEEGLEDDRVLSEGEAERFLNFLNYAIELAFASHGEYTVLYLKEQARLAVNQIVTTSNSVLAYITNRKTRIQEALDYVAEKLNLT